MDSKINLSLICFGAIILITVLITHSIEIHAMNTALASGFSGNINIGMGLFYYVATIGAAMIGVGTFKTFKPRRTENDT